MSWRERLRQNPSNAEIEILIELQRRGLTTLLETQKGFRFDPEVDGVEGTRIDYYWNPPYNYAVFLDGEPIHGKDRQSERDELITKALEKRGIRVDRFSYRPPLTKRRKIEIVDQIEETLNLRAGNPPP